MIARKHLDQCDQLNCRFCKPIHEDDNSICCFGLRHEGCIYSNPKMEHIIDELAIVEAQLSVAKYEVDPYWAARTRNEQIDLPEMDGIINPIIDEVSEITKKVYNFVYRGHEYIHSDNSMDYRSCPHCGYSGNSHKIGYYGNGISRIICFECDKCFEKFYYHNPE